MSGLDCPQAEPEAEERAWESTKPILCTCKSFILLQSLAFVHNLVDHLVSIISLATFGSSTIDRVRLQDAIR
jgi:hypothetical protein